jgi:hypothetical protein
MRRKWRSIFPGKTLSRTNLGELEPGDPVNLEPALRPGTELGGHFVLGHVDTVGKITILSRRGEDFLLEVSFDPAFAELLADKGSVAVDGISLTPLFRGRGHFPLRHHSLHLGKYELAVPPRGRPGEPRVRHFGKIRATLEGKMRLATVEEAIEAIKAGKMIIVVDDENRENEGDLVMAAEKATPEAINFMIKEGRGASLRAHEPGVGRTPGSPPHGEPAPGQPRNGVHRLRGRQRGDHHRNLRLRSLADHPGFGKPPIPVRRTSFGRATFFPLIAKDGGVLRRAGHTEAAVDLCRLAGLAPVGVICEIMNDDGTMARLPDLLRFAEKHGLLILTIADLIAWRKKAGEARRAGVRGRFSHALRPFPHHHLPRQDHGV